MKKLLPILLALMTVSVFAQSPQSFNYQAVVRDVSGNALSNQPIGLRVAILQGSQNGAIVYQESFSPTTNLFGLANVMVGTGNVLNGVFATIDWANGPYYMQTAIDPSGGNAYAVMGTSQLISVPYALHAKTAENSFSGDYNDLTNTPVGGGSNTLDMAYDQGGAGAGRSITADAGEVEITTATPSGIGLRVTNTNTGVAILAQTTNAPNTSSAIQAQTNSSSTAVSAVVGSTSGAAWAITGQAEANSTTEAAVYGSNLRTNGGHGVLGIGFNGLVGQTNYSQGNAVFGENADAIGSGNGIGVAGRGYWGVVGEDRYLGAQAGTYGVLSNGDFSATGTKAFLIDHPSDPENKFLKHFSSESNEVLNIYRGNVIFDVNGEAVVSMPDYYDLINRNPSYQLTPVGEFAQLFVKKELENGVFTIAGGSEGKKASWTIYSERNDPYLQQYPEKRTVEVEKRDGQKGKYFMPQLYGKGMDKKLIQTGEKDKVEQAEIQLNK